MAGAPEAPPKDGWGLGEELKPLEEGCFFDRFQGRRDRFCSPAWSDRGEASGVHAGESHDTNRSLPGASDGCVGGGADLDGHSAQMSDGSIGRASADGVASVADTGGDSGAVAGGVAGGFAGVVAGKGGVSAAGADAGGGAVGRGARGRATGACLGGCGAVTGGVATGGVATEGAVTGGAGGRGAAAA